MSKQTHDDGMSCVEFARAFLARANHPGVKLVINDCIQEIERLENLLFSMGAMDLGPCCFRCGYNGSGYYDPEVHPCAKLHHEATR